MIVSRETPETVLTPRGGPTLPASVMAGLDPAIQAVRRRQRGLNALRRRRLDGRVKPGHDSLWVWSCAR